MTVRVIRKRCVHEPRSSRHEKALTRIRNLKSEIQVNLPTSAATSVISWRVLTMSRSVIMKMKLCIPLLCLLLAGCATNGTYSSARKPIRVLIVGGGSSHDFDRWFNQADTAMLRALGKVEVSYTDKTDSIVPMLKSLDVLFLSNNQPIT